jgi:Spy/CpxP family protein refolding chaperone
MQRLRFLALTIAATGLLAYTSTAVAQAGGQAPSAAPADSGRRMFDPVGRLLAQRDELKITDEQAARLEAVRTKYLEKHQAQMDDLRRNREGRAAFRASMDSTRTEVMAVLTPEQQKQVTEMRKQWRREHEGRHRHGHKHDGHDDDDGDK